jgi:1-acyl-sn-glycerol-3-phosphate acyltransferase
VDSRIKSLLKKVSYALSKVFFGTLLGIYFRVRVRGRKNIPKDGGFLLAANHFSFADPLILGAFLPRRLWFVMAEDQFARPVVHHFSRLMDVIPVRTGAAFQLSAVKKVLHRLRRGHGVAIFPEGRRSQTGKLLPPLPGVGVFASRGGVPVVPVAIVGTREAYPVGCAIPRPKRVTLYVGEPLKGLGSLAPEAIAQRVMEAVAELLRRNGHADYVDGAAGSAAPTGPSALPGGG